MPIATADPARVRSASLVFDPHGQQVARYDKIHLFAFSQGDERYDESKTIRIRERGRAPSIRQSGRVGLSVCSDLRFPELYRSYRDVALIVVPSAVTAVTGAAHTGTCCSRRARSRAVLMCSRPREGGTHANSRRAHMATAMLIDPWGHGRGRVGGRRRRHRRRDRRCANQRRSAPRLAGSGASPRLA